MTKNELYIEAAIGMGFTLRQAHWFFNAGWTIDEVVGYAKENERAHIQYVGK